VAGGLLKNIARSDGNATGATSTYQSFGGKWLELLKEAAPRRRPPAASRPISVNNNRSPTDLRMESPGRAKGWGFLTLAAFSSAPLRAGQALRHGFAKPTR
jgi:hypothetical protein